MRASHGRYHRFGKKTKSTRVSLISGYAGSLIYRNLVVILKMRRIKI